MLVFFFRGGGGVLTKNGEGKSYFIELYRDLSRNVFLQESSQLCGVNFAKDLHPKKTWIPKMMVFLYGLEKVTPLKYGNVWYLY